MCGIAGIIIKNKTKSSLLKKFEKCVYLIAHRGPDHFGFFKNVNIALYHYRLSIIDLKPRANQPFTFPPSENQLIYNGEIYNYEELAIKYRIKQETTSDTEVLYKLYQIKGIDVLPEMNGIFAFAYYDKHRQILSLVRDRLGIKPLYYINHPNFFAFASEAKVLMNFLNSFKLNFQALHEFLWFGSSINYQTIVKGIYKLQPGSQLIIDLNTFKISQKYFWNVKKDIIQKGLISDDYEIAKMTTRKLLEKAVERQCISDVPVGAYLSGGIDSSTIVALASRYTSGKLHTFSVSFDKNLSSELPLARKIARKYNTEHYEFEVTTRNLEEDIEKLVFQYDEPFADPAAIPLHLMAQQNKMITKVVLQGDGGDELFAGYGRHLDLSQFRLRKWAFRLLSVMHYNKARRKTMKQRSLALNAKLPWERMALLVANPMELRPVQLIDNHFHQRLLVNNPFKTYQELFPTLQEIDPMQAMLYTDMQIILPHTFLEKVDKVNMLHSIEARVPFLDNDLVEYVMRLPSHYKLQKGITKFFLREIVYDLLPPDVLNGRKISFGTPIGEWLRTTLYAYVKNLFKVAYTEWNHFLNVELLLKMLDEHKKSTKDHSALLWRFVILIIWLNHYQNKIRLD